jgi:hypothetical protein
VGPASRHAGAGTFNVFALAAASPPATGTGALTEPLYVPSAPRFFPGAR